MPRWRQRIVLRKGTLPMLWGSLVILTLAILNPLACLIHCADHAAMAAETPPAYLAHYVCLMGNQAHATSAASTQDPSQVAPMHDAPMPKGTALASTVEVEPQAVYAGILIALQAVPAPAASPQAHGVRSPAIPQQVGGPPLPPPES
jgi:hypothetical protein